MTVVLSKRLARIFYVWNIRPQKMAVSARIGFLKMNKVTKKVVDVAVAYATEEVTSYLYQEFQKAGGVSGVVAKVGEAKDYALERGGNIVTAVKSGDKDAVLTEAKNVADDGVGAVIGATRFAGRGAKHIGTKHANMARAVKRYIQDFRS